MIKKTDLHKVLLKRCEGISYESDRIALFKFNWGQVELSKITDNFAIRHVNYRPDVVGLQRYNGKKEIEKIFKEENVPDFIYQLTSL